MQIPICLDCSGKLLSAIWNYDTLDVCSGIDSWDKGASVNTAEFADNELQWSQYRKKGGKETLTLKSTKIKRTPRENEGKPQKAMEDLENHCMHV